MKIHRQSLAKSMENFCPAFGLDNFIELLKPTRDAFHNNGVYIPENDSIKWRDISID